MQAYARADIHAFWHTHSCRRTCIHTHSFMQTYMQLGMYACRCVHTRGHTCMQTYIRTDTHASRHTRMQTHANANTCECKHMRMQAHTYANAHAYRHICNCTLVQVHMYALVQGYRYARMQKHTRSTQPFRVYPSQVARWRRHTMFERTV